MKEKCLNLQELYKQYQKSTKSTLIKAVSPDKIDNIKVSQIPINFYKKPSVTQFRASSISVKAPKINEKPSGSERKTSLKFAISNKKEQKLQREISEPIKVLQFESCSKMQPKNYL